MASYSETTAIALRRGNHAENMSFTGTVGEVTADLGIVGDGTDIETTLRLHNGINPGGIALARQDCTNISTKALAENRQWLSDANLAYANLSNLEQLSSSTAIANVLNILHSYGLATETQIEELDEAKANVNMSNVITSTLASGRTEDAEGKNGNLAYTNMSNVNTKYLASNTYRSGVDNDKALAYADNSNVNTTNLTLAIADRPINMQGPVIAKADLSNVDDNTINERISDLNVEYKTNKDTYINTGSSELMTHYPTVGAVIDYVTESIENIDYLDPYFNKTKSWEALYTSAESDIHFDTNGQNIITAGTGFTTKQLAFADSDSKYVSTLAPTNFNGTDILEEMPLQLAIYTLNSGDEDDPSLLQPSSFRLYPEYGTTNVASQEITFVTENGSQLVGNLESVAHPTLSGVYKYVFTEISVTGYDWEPIPEGMNTSIINAPKYNSSVAINVMPVLTAEILNIDENGGITSLLYIPSEVSVDVSAVSSYIYHPVLVDETVQTGTNSNVTIKTINNLPTIGGAGLLKSSLDNLPGMTDAERAANNGAKWTVDKSKTVNRADVTISAAEYDRLITAGQMWDTVKNTTAVTIRKWS